MNTFDFFSVGRILFGRGTFDQVGHIAASFGQSAMIVTNAGEPGQGGLPDRLASLLGEAGVGSCVMRLRGEPHVADVDRALQLARENDCDVVLGMGGGSAIDAAKAVAGILTSGGSPLDYMEVIGKGQKLTRPAAPWIAIPTTAGTGAEATRNAVLAYPEKGFKASLRSEYLLAKVAIIDGDLGVGVRAEITARSGMDALSQLIESYTSIRAQPITDALAWQGMGLAAEALPRAYADGSDVDAREKMALAALFSGIALGNAGLGAVHGFAAPLGANFPIPHGTVCAALLPHVMSANVRALRAEAPDHPWLARYATIGRTLTGEMETSEAAAADAGIRFVGQLAEQLDVPPLRSFGLTSDRFTEMVQLAEKSSSIRYNPVKLSRGALREILELAW